MQTIITAVNHTRAAFDSRVARDPATAFQVARATESIATQTLRRNGVVATEWGMRSGSRLATARLATAAVDPTIFGRRAAGADRAEIGVEIIIDRSGSMLATDSSTMTRLERARAMAAGIAAAARNLALPCAVGHHGTIGPAAHAVAHRATATMLQAPAECGNYDAWSLARWLDSVTCGAERRLIILLNDGAPCGDKDHHETLARECVRRIERDGGQFVSLFVGSTDDEGSRARAVSDWGARRCADCSRSPASMADAITRAIAAMRGR